MKRRYLEVTFRKGKPVAADLYLARAVEVCSPNRRCWQRASHRRAGGNRSVSRLLHHDWRRWSSSTPQWCCWSRTHAATGMGAAKSGLTFSLRRKPNLQVTAASMTRHLQRPREWPPSALENGSTSRSSTRDGVSLSDVPECSEPIGCTPLAARIDFEARSPVGCRDVMPAGRFARARTISLDRSG
jgi:hypothetical protein